MATFTSSLDAIGAWREQRLPLARYAPLALLIAWGAGGSGIAGSGGLIDSALALSLIAQYRLWDDLVDRVRDRSAHPERLLARVASTSPFVHAAVVLAVANAAALGLRHGWLHAFGAGTLIVTIALWYRRHRARGLVHAQVLLVKYPAFVVLLAAWPPEPRALAAALAVYAAMCAFELLDTPFEHAAAKRLAFAAHALVLAATPMLVRTDVPAMLAAALGAALMAVAWRARTAAAAGAVRYLPFAHAVVVLLLIHRGAIE